MNNLAHPKIVGYQSWRDLTFIHWRIDPDEMQRTLPAGLTVDTFDDSAWLAVVPFSMERVRPWWAPAVPFVSWFLETNVRTYVKHENGQTGVWFFSLDADQRLAVTVARRFWHLNYVYSLMSMFLQDDRLVYSGIRPRASVGHYDIQAEVDSAVPLQTAMVGSLEFFLLERYHLFAQRPDGSFLCGQVHHDPYQYRPLSSAVISQSLTDAAGFPIPPDAAPDHMAYSPGVDVRVSGLRLA